MQAHISDHQSSTQPFGTSTCAPVSSIRHQQNFATPGPSRHSKLKVIVPNLTQLPALLRQRLPLICRLRTASLLAALAAAACTAASAATPTAPDSALPMAPSAVLAATPSSSSLRGINFAAQSPSIRYSSNIAVQQATTDPLPLSLDDAINLGVKQNLQVLLAGQTELAVRGQILAAIYELMPNLKAVATTDAVEANLAALGFKRSSLAAFGLPPDAIHTIVKIQTTGAQLNADQVLFNLPDFYLYSAAKKAQNVVTMNLLNVRGGVVQAVGTQYLAALADQAQIANHQALLTADQEVLRQATLSHDAGVGINLDVLRARVQLQTEQQALINAQNSFAKD